MTAPVRFPRFFVTSPAPCPYLDGKTERKVFTELKGPHSEQLNEALGRIGFRRSQTVAYRPSCIDCQACVSIRVAASEFEMSRTQSRNVRRNGDLVATECRPWATEEQFELLQRYLGARHPGGGMTAMDEMDFADMVEHTPVSSLMIEYREPAHGNNPGQLVGVCLTDQQTDGLSMVYSFYDPEHGARTGLGSYIILEHIRRAADYGLPFVYLGYWVDGSDRMQYKVRYRPIEVLGRDGWRRVSRTEQDAYIASALQQQGGRSRAESGAAKDGAQDQYRIDA